MKHIYNQKWTVYNRNNSLLPKVRYLHVNLLLPHRQIKYPVDFDDELEIGDVRYDKMT